MELVSGPSAGSSSASSRNAEAACDVGKVMTGSGFAVDNGAGQAIVNEVRPRGFNTTPTAVFLQAHEEDSYSGSWSLRGWAICADSVSGLAFSSIGHAFDDVDGMEVTGTCASGKRLLSGGHVISMIDLTAREGEIGVHNLDVTQNLVGGQSTQVEVEAERLARSDESWSLGGYAICATA
ncbi:hypothetical protein [Acrocarpospora phusangensis]|nr:hypothetical protein [Acrocarpospora phusangensis]